ncbi:Holliday junction branch migration protein RuvA [Armatimonas rosea]|jgi:holliday junction DNA helicase RuvA|uniref:Holliday junction branch migration complex subunit RuvA n=1 Tax=Armatimonas rosea TaxID=685828 RepID=A0A7W9SU19_ARMRO|nr:Holliday junction branch migration protein RuvA [Armatimonas rosea]MBB6052820.1 Holliday junction DNA helicase RuvA [Armatimonas rosea]
MIAQLTGKVVRVATPAVVLDVNGVGYKVSVPLSVIEQLPADGSPVTLVTHMIVREDDLSLYGFLEESDQQVFELLLTVSGVGPKVALGLLSALGGDGIARVVSSEDVRAITKTPGIGPKLAQRLVLELKDKLMAYGFSRKVEHLAASATVKVRSANDQLLEDVSSALTNLGYNKNDALKAAELALTEALKTDSSPQFATVLRAGLNRLSR